MERKRQFAGIVYHNRIGRNYSEFRINTEYGEIEENPVCFRIEIYKKIITIHEKSQKTQAL